MAEVTEPLARWNAGDCAAFEALVPRIDTNPKQRHPC
jgi:hypothetical protein